MPFQDSTNLNSISKYIVDVNGGTPYTTIQSALDAAQAEITAGGATAASVYVRPGVYTENLICYPKVDLLATQSQTDSGITEIVGTHTPPLTGYSGWFGFLLTGATAIWQSNAAGTARLGQWNITCRLTGDGYTYDLPNWVGEINLWGFLDLNGPGINGWVNNATGSSEVNAIFSGVGLGPRLGTMLINGSLELQGMLIGPKIRLTGNATCEISMGSEILNTIELRDNSTANIQNSYFETGIEEAINTTSTLPISLGNVCINSTADPVINGTGPIQMGSVSFMNSSTIAGTVTQTYMRTIDRTTPYVVGPTGNFVTIQAALDAASTTGNAELVIIQGGTYTENLTLYDGIDLWGAIGVADTETCKIVGTHTPPATGTFTCRNIFLESATDILNSAVAGTATLILIDCAIDVTNGYTFNLLNWTGSLVGFDIGEIQSTNDGWINNTGGADVFMTDVTIGAGIVNTMIVSGTTELYNVHCQCPITFQGIGTAAVHGGCWFDSILTTADTVTVDISNATFTVAAGQVIIHNSTNDLTLSGITIDGVTTPPIGGTGTINLGLITFLNAQGFAIGLTLNRFVYSDIGIVRGSHGIFNGGPYASQRLIELTAVNTIGLNETWVGAYINGVALNPTAAGTTIYGIDESFVTLNITNDPLLAGIRLRMPLTFSGDACKAAMLVTGWGDSFTLLCGDTGHVIDMEGEVCHTFDGTGSAAGSSLTANNIVIDYDTSTGGDIHALDVAVSGTGTATVVGLGTHTDVAPIHQHIGAFGAVAQGWKFNGGFTDTTVAFNAAGTDVSVFDNDNDYIYIGSNAVFDEIEVILDTVADRSVFPVFEYSIAGPAWTVFTPGDDTNGFTQNGTIRFESSDLAGWASVVVNGANHFYIRIQRTRNNIGTTPIEDTIQILAATQYYWNETGDILANTVTAAGLTDSTRTQYAVAVYGAGGALAELPLGNYYQVYSSDGAGSTGTWRRVGLEWAEETGVTKTIVVQHEYMANRGGGVAFALPATAAFGDMFAITGFLGLWSITQGAGQSIRYGAFTTTVGAGGSIVATNVGDCVYARCIVTNTTWRITSSIGNLVVN